MQKALAVLALMLCSIASSPAQVSFGFQSPGVSIGVNLPVYPDLVRIPGYPVYYAPQLPTNYFFYDGLYWVFDGTNWYASSWYNGPWQFVTADVVPLYLLRVPVRYYRAPPVYFRGWAVNAPPRWGSHWGERWASSHRGWDRWNHAAAPAPAPLPTYQRRYAGNRYPDRAEQRTLESRNYHYQPRDRFAERHLEQRPGDNARASDSSSRPGPGQNERQRARTERPDEQRLASPPGAPHATPPAAHRSAPVAVHPAPAAPPVAAHRAPAPPVASRRAPETTAQHAGPGMPADAAPPASRGAAAADQRAAAPRTHAQPHHGPAAVAAHGEGRAPQARAEGSGPQARGPAPERASGADDHAHGERREPRNNG